MPYAKSQKIIAMKNPITSNYFQLLPTLFLIIFFACKEEEPIIESKQQTEVSKATDVENSTGRTKASGQYIMTDWSGQVEVLIKFEDKGPAQSPFGSVLIPSEYVLVGGGAETFAVEAGAFLTESRPDWDNNTWYAKSKDHYYADVHQLRVYAIGLKIQGVTPATLRSVMKISEYTLPGKQGHPATSAWMQSPYILIGGGARANWSTYGSLLYHSYPSGQGWYVASKDHIYSEPTTITAWAIGIQDYIPGFGYIDITVNYPLYPNTVSSGWSTSYTVGSGVEWVPTCVGAYENYSQGGAGRMLTIMKPRTDPYGYTIATSKDHRYTCGGTITSYVMLIRKRH